MAPPTGSVPPGRRRAAAAVLLEALGLAGYGVWLGVATLTGSPTNRGLSYAAAAIWVLAAGGLALAARGLRRGRRAAASPVVLVQLIGVPVGLTLAGNGAPVAGALVLALSVATLVLLFGSPATRESLRRR